MRGQQDLLVDLLERLIRMNNECSCNVSSECGLSELTVRQIAYLKVIDQQGEVTFSRLAEITRNSKPTITEMVNKFVRMDCVYRERCPADGRIQYIRLTEKGQKIAQAEHYALQKMIERMMDSLDERDLDLLLGILQKIR